MAQIFNQAREVAIWLGNPPEVTTDIPIDDAELFLALVQQRSPWWERLWVIQECAYAGSCPTVLLPDASISLGDLLGRWAVVIESRSDDSLVRAFRMLQLPYNIWKAQYETNAHRLPLRTRLQETFDLQCSDPHDRIYAILNLVDEAEIETVVPDYRKPIGMLKREMEAILMKSPSDLELKTDFWPDSFTERAIWSSHSYPELTSDLRPSGSITERAMESFSNSEVLSASRPSGLYTERAVESSSSDAELTGDLWAPGSFTERAMTNVWVGPGATLQEYAYRGDIKGVTRLISEVVDIDEEDGHHGSALQAAAAGGSLEVV